jgi:hypothetical protein
MKKGDYVVFKEMTFEGYRCCYEVLDEKVIKRKKDGYTYNMIKINLLGYAPVDLLMSLEDAVKIDPKDTKYADAEEVHKELNSQGIYKSRED